jgi:hypothetical protein
MTLRTVSLAVLQRTEKRRQKWSQESSRKALTIAHKVTKNKQAIVVFCLYTF